MEKKTEFLVASKNELALSVCLPGLWFLLGVKCKWMPVNIAYVRLEKLIESDKGGEIHDRLWL